MSIAVNNGLWIPQDITDLLTVSVDGNADAATICGMEIINGAANQWVKGVIDDHYYFDLLAQFEIDPYLFVGEVEEHLALLMRS